MIKNSVIYVSSEVNDVRSFKLRYNLFMEFIFMRVVRFILYIVIGVIFFVLGIMIMFNCVFLYVD